MVKGPQVWFNFYLWIQVFIAKQQRLEVILDFRC